MIHWLNSMPTLPSSLMEKDFDAWRQLYRKYLIGLEQYKTGMTSRMNAQQRPEKLVCSSDSATDRGYLSEP
jgi:hypothetical protein